MTTLVCREHEYTILEKQVKQVLLLTTARNQLLPFSECPRLIEQGTTQTQVVNDER